MYSHDTSPEKWFSLEPMPTTPEPHAIAVIVLTFVAFFLFSRDRIPIETTSLIILSALTLGFQIFPYEQAGETLKVSDFFLGFGHEALITISALMILGRGLVATGALEPVARLFSRVWSSFPKGAMLLLLIFSAAASGLVNDTPIVVLMMPILISIALRTGTSPTKSLLSMNYAVLLGGMSTSIGTSTNLLVVAIAADLGVRQFGIFDFTPLAATAAIGGILYIWLVMPRILPDRESPMANAAPRLFSAILYINEDSFANGKKIMEVLKRTENRIKIDRIVRGENLTLARLPTLTLNAGDRIFLSDTPENLKEYETLLEATLYNVGDEEERVTEESPLTAPDEQLAEIVVTEGSLLHKSTLQRTHFSEIFDVLILALHNRGHNSAVSKGNIRKMVLRVGDVLLVQGTKENIAALRTDPRMLVLDQTIDLPTTVRAPLALIIMGAAVVLAVFKILPISVSALLGVLAMLLTRCLNWSDVGSSLSTKIILLIASSLALGVALTRTGGTDYIAQWFIILSQSLSPELTLGLLMLLMALFTNFVSNNAAAAIGTPIAVSIASNLGLSPEPFVLAILFGANFCYATPMAYQTNLMVMSAGGYRFSDFVRAGVPLVIIMLTLYTILLPRFFPF